MSRTTNQSVTDRQTDIYSYNVPNVSVPEDRNLIKRTLDLYRGRFDDNVGYGVYNLVSILQKTRVDLSGEDFSELDLSRCMLNGTPLSRKGCCADFHGAKINRSTVFSTGQRGNISAVCYSPDNKYLVTASDDNMVTVRDTRTHAVIAVIGDTSDIVHTIAYINNGDYLLTASYHSPVKIWNAATYEFVTSLDHYVESHAKDEDDDSSYSVNAKVSPDGRYIATWSLHDNHIGIWDTITFGLVKNISTDANVYSLFFHPDSNAVAVKVYRNDGSARIELWDIFKENCSLSCDIYSVDAYEPLCFTPDKESVLLESFVDYTLHRLTIASPATVEKIEITGEQEMEIHNALYTPDGDELIVFGKYIFGNDMADDLSVVLLTLDPVTMTIKNSIDIPLGVDNGIIDCSAFSPDGRNLALAPAYSEYDLFIVDMEQYQIESTIRSAEAFIASLEILHDGKQFMTLNNRNENILRIWKTMTGKCVNVFDCGGVDIDKTALIPDTSTLLIACGDGSIKLFDTASLKFTGELKGSAAHVKKLACSCDGRYTVTVDDKGQVRIWNLVTREYIGKIPFYDNIYPTYEVEISDIRFLPSSEIAILSNAVPFLNNNDDKISLSASEIVDAYFNSYGMTGVLDYLSFLTGEKIETIGLISSLSRWNINGEMTDSLDIEEKYYSNIILTADDEVMLHGVSGCAAYELSSKTLLREIPALSLGEKDIGMREYLCGVPNKVVMSKTDYSPSDNSTDSTLYIIDARTGVTLSEKHFPARVYLARFTPDEKNLLVYTFDDKLTILDSATCAVLGVLNIYSGMNILGCDMRDLHIDSGLTYDDIDDLRRYGAIVD